MPTCCAPGSVCTHYPKGCPTPKTYHKDLGFPEGLVVTPPPGLWLFYTNHARRAAHDEGLKLADLPVRLPLGLDVIEVEVMGGYIQKWVLRDGAAQVFRHGQYDIVLVVLLDGTVKTLWLNHYGDTHRTLQRERYTVPSVIASSTPNL